MTFDETVQLVKELNIAENEDDIVFKAAVFMLYSISNSTVGCYRLRKETGYNWKVIWFLDNNFRANGILKGHRWYICLGEDELQNVIEITCCSLAAAGQLVRLGDETPIRRTIYSYDEYFNDETGKSKLY